MDGLRTLGMAFLVILAVIGAGVIFFFVTCMVALGSLYH